MLKCIRKVGNMELFIRPKPERPAPEPESAGSDYPLFIRINNRPVYRDETVPILLLMLSAIAVLFNYLVLGHGFTVKPGQDPTGVAFTLAFSVLFAGLFWASLHTLLMGFPYLGEIGERWLVLTTREVFFLEGGRFRVFVSFSPRLAIKSFERGHLKRLAFHYHYEMTNAGRGCMDLRVLPNVLIWNLLIFDISRPEQKDPRSDPDFNAGPVYLGDLPYESAKELRDIWARWLPETTELRPLPPLKKLEGK